jgi:putative endonuclease
MSRVADKPYFLYVLWSATGQRFYLGISEDPDHRLEQHNAPDADGWTRRYQPWTIVHIERYESFGDARRRELDLKAQKGGAGFFRKTGLDPSQFKRG